MIEGQAKRDPPYLAQLLRDHPSLRGEKALEMIKEAAALTASKQRDSARSSHEENIRQSQVQDSADRPAKGS